MYRERFVFATRNGTSTIADAQLPAGHVKFDQTFQKNVETYRGDLTIRIPVKQATGPFDLSVTSQGCADAGICYPPMERVYHVSGAALQAATAATTTDIAAPTQANALSRHPLVRACDERGLCAITAAGRRVFSRSSGCTSWQASC